MSLFSGCGGLDLGFEGDFEVLSAAVNPNLNPNWNLQKTKDSNWVHLDKTRFQTVFANDIREDAKAAWARYFRKKDICESTYYLDSIVDLVKLQQENKIRVFPANIHVVTGGFPPATLRQAFIGLEEPEKSADISQQKYSRASYLGRSCQGQNEVNLEGIGPTIRPERHGNIEYRRLSQANGGQNLLELEAGLKERRLSVRECARIQTFPDDYEFVFRGQAGSKGVSASDAYKLIGNALPPFLGYHIAKRLEYNWEKYFKEE